MKREDIKTILGENVSEEQITNLLNAFHSSNSDTKKELDELKGKLDKFNDYDNIKAKLTEYEQASMTEQQKLEAEKEQVAKNLRESKMILNTTKAKNILAGYNLDDKTIDMLVREDEQSTIYNATSFKETLDNLKVSVEKNTRESLSNINLTPTMSNIPQQDNVMTLDKFNSLTADEQNKFITEHYEEFQKL